MKSKLRKNGLVYFALVFILCSIWGTCGCPGQKAKKETVAVDIETLKSRLSLETEIDEKTSTKVSKGTFAVFEDHKAQKGRMIHLNVVILHVTGENPKPDPVFIIAGGPGEDVTKRVKGYRGGPGCGKNVTLCLSAREARVEIIFSVVIYQQMMTICRVISILSLNWRLFTPALKN